MIEYTVQKGWYDLSKKPKTLTKKEHKICQNTQMALRREERLLKGSLPDEMSKELSAKLNLYVLEHCLERENEDD